APLENHTTGDRDVWTHTVETRRAFFHHRSRGRMPPRHERCSAGFSTRLWSPSLRGYPVWAHSQHENRRLPADAWRGWRAAHAAQPGSQTPGANTYTAHREHAARLLRRPGTDRGSPDPRGYPPRRGVDHPAASREASASHTRRLG